MVWLWSVYLYLALNLAVFKNSRNNGSKHIPSTCNCAAASHRWRQNFYGCAGTSLEAVTDHALEKRGIMVGA